MYINILTIFKLNVRTKNGKKTEIINIMGKYLIFVKEKYLFAKE